MVNTARTQINSLNYSPLPQQLTNNRSVTLPKYGRVGYLLWTEKKHRRPVSRNNILLPGQAFLLPPGTSYWSAACWQKQLKTQLPRYCCCCCWGCCCSSLHRSLSHSLGTHYIIRLASYWNVWWNIIAAERVVFLIFPGMTKTFHRAKKKPGLYVYHYTYSACVPL